MSDDWQVPDDLADRVRRLDRTDAWAREIERTAEVRAILTDLLTELREQVEWYPPDVFPDFTADDPASQSRTPDRIAGVAMRDAWTRAAQMADRAETRLRDVSKPKGHDDE